MNELALFAGAGGGILGGKLCGFRTVCAVEIEPFCREVLLRRQMDGFLPRFPIWDDVKTFDGKSWKGKIDIITGGFPCQDISAAGQGQGIDGERSGPWKEMARIIREVRPYYAFVENSPMLTSRGLGTVLGDLAEMGYDAQWCVLGASDVGAPHVRKRIWVLAHSMCERLERIVEGSEKPIRKTVRFLDAINTRSASFNLSEPIGIRTNDGLAFRVDRTKAIGNGQVPAVARLAWQILSEGLLDNRQKGK